MDIDRDKLLELVEKSVLLLREISNDNPQVFSAILTVLFASNLATLDHSSGNDAAANDEVMKVDMMRQAMKNIGLSNLIK